MQVFSNDNSGVAGVAQYSFNRRELVQFLQARHTSGALN